MRCALTACTVTLAAMLGACFSPSYPTCAFSCGQSGLCPAGYSCDPGRQLCCRIGSPLPGIDANADRSSQSEGLPPPLDLQPLLEGQIRELAAQWDTDGDWATGQAVHATASVGVLWLTPSPGSVSASPKTVSQSGSGVDWCKGPSFPCNTDLSGLAQGNSIFSETTSKGQLTRTLNVTPDFGQQALPSKALVDEVKASSSRSRARTGRTGASPAPGPWDTRPCPMTGTPSGGA